MKTRIYDHLQRALREKNADKEFAYLPPAEKKAIRTILKATLKDLPAAW
jgi:hypothetical protein